MTAASMRSGRRYARHSLEYKKFLIIIKNYMDDVPPC